MVQAHLSVSPSPEPWRWVHFTAISGLPSTDIGDLCETPSGTVWVATPQGVAWYNGFFWTAIDSSLGLPALPIKKIIALSDERVVVHIGNNLYVGTARGFQPLSVGTKKALPPVSQMAPLGKDSIVLMLPSASQQPRLQLYTNNTLTPFALPYNVQDSTGEDLQRFHYTKSQYLWLSTTKGLYRFQHAAWKKICGFGKDIVDVSHILEKPSGDGYFFADPGTKRGLWSFTNTGAIQYVGMGHFLNISSTDIAPNGSILVAYFNGLIDYYNGSRWNLITPTQTETIGISFIRYRSNGDLWVAAAKQFSLYRNSIKRWTYENLGTEGTSNSILEILHARDSTLWVATGHGLYKKTPHQAWQAITSIHGIELRGLTGLAQDGKGNIWISSGASFEGAFQWNGSQWKHFTARDGLAAERVHKIRIDRKGNPWFLSLQASPGTDGNGAFVYSNGTFSQWDTARGLMHNRLYSFVEGPDGAYWFGTIGGISRWHKGVWKYWRSSNEKNRIYALAADSTGRIWYSWIPQNSVGYILNDSLHTVPLIQSSYTAKGEQPIVLELETDARNRVWIATQGNGLYCYNNGVLSNFQTNAGLRSVNLWPILSVGDRLYVGTIGRGLDILSFGEEATPLPQVRFDTPTIEENRVTLYWRAFAFWGQIPYDDIETRYRINNDEWSPWSKKRDAIINHMPSGTHTLQVQTKGFFPTYTSLPYTTTFTIPPPFYQRPLFLAPFALLAIIVLWSAGNTILRKRKFNAALQKLNKELEQKVQERTLKLVEANTQLQAEIRQRAHAEENLTTALLKEKELHDMKSRFVSMVSHEFRTPLSIILSSTDLLDYYTDKLSPEEKQKYLNRIKDSVEHIVQLMNNALFIEKANANKIEIHPVQLNVQLFCSDLIAELSKKYSTATRIHYTYKGTHTSITADRQLLHLMLFHILSNALQYSPMDTAIDVTVTHNSDTVAFAVVDKGEGIPPSDLEKVAEAFHRGTNAEMIPGTGLGLAIAHNCVRLHQGTIHINSSHQGTTVTVSLPVQYEHNSGKRPVT